LPKKAFLPFITNNCSIFTFLNAEFFINALFTNEFSSGEIAVVLLSADEFSAPELSFSEFC
jgi:hypothetical protein